ncbi:hypothetical protein POM88_004608 [Heracleum sosnowskyi]|uniref:Uncharacterized protein n=1 Tax=Heracleum sosnowskyi TaxID=360622 RepID=A0AAD8NEK7_9APIA|nr:hypothetical protein POM88_004608 [Heracleum sosnowskyi]
MFRTKKVKKDSGLSSPKNLEHKPHVWNGRKSMSVSAASIIELIKPRYSFWESKKNKKERMPLPKVEESVMNKRDRNLKEWILSSPRTNNSGSSYSKQSSGRIHPAFDEIVEAATPKKILPRDAFCLEGSDLKSINDDDEEVEKNDSKMSPSAKKNRKVRFMLPQVVDIFVLDSADGYYFSN